MSRIRIKHFGPIKDGCLIDDGWLDIKKVTVFIGNQGSGKSTVAKLISTFIWLEKALTRGDYDIEYFERPDILSEYLKYHKIQNYFIFSDDPLNMHTISEIEYQGSSYSIKYKDRCLQIEKQPGSDYPLPQVMYVPADRNFLSTADDLKLQRLLSEALTELLTELQKARRRIPVDFPLPINNASLKYDKDKDLLYIKGTGYEINLTESSSGFQSLVPLYLVSWYLADSVKQQSDMRKEPMSSDELERFRQGVAAIWSNVDLTEEQKRAALSELSSKFNKTAFINIVEEPEQNLFPESQWQMLKSLLIFNNMNKGNKLIMTTHSPYIISDLTLSVKAFGIYQKIKGLEESGNLSEKLFEMVPRGALVNPDDLIVYELDDAGNIIKLDDYKGLPSDRNYLNEGLEKSNDLFARLIDLEDSCQ